MIEQTKNSIKLSREEIANHFEKALRLESKILIDYMIKEIKVFLEMNGLTYTKDPSLTEAYEQALLALLPKNKRD